MRCPVCRAENGLEPTCRRCKADLGLVVAVETQRQHALADAARCAQAGDGDGALHAAQLAHELRPGADSLRMTALGHLLRRDYPHALQNRNRAAADLPPSPPLG